MSGFDESMVAQFVFVQTPDLIFSDLVDELGEALDRAGAGERTTQWDCEDLALMDLGGLRFALAWCQHPLDAEAACLTLSVGPAPGGDGRLGQGLHPEEMCQLLARRLESVLLPDMTFWHQVDGPVDSAVIDRLTDNLPEVGVMRSIGAFRAKPRPFASVQADAATDADIDAMLARVAEPDMPAPPRPEEPRATANSTVADPPGAVVDLVARLSGDAPARQAARRSTPRAAPVPVTAAAAAILWDIEPDTPAIQPVASQDTTPATVALHVVAPATIDDDDLPRPVAPEPVADAPCLPDVAPIAIDADEDDAPAAAPAPPAKVTRVVRPARATRPRTPRPDPDQAAAALRQAEATVAPPENGSLEERARLRSALYPPEEPATPADQPSPQLRLAAHAMDATLIVVAPPVGAALMTYGLLRGGDLMRSGRAMALTCTVVGLMQGPLLALI